MHPEHAILLDDIRKAGRPMQRDATPENDSYGSGGRPYYLVSVLDRRAMARRWVAAHRNWTAEAVLAVVESLLNGESHEEKTLATLLLRYSAKARSAVPPADIDRWLGMLNGWAEIDSLCQNLFVVEDLLGDWLAWKDLIERLSKSPDINRRRASLVLLTGPVHYVDDVRFRDLALAVIDRLKLERPILITKAVSWLLRCLVDRHQAAVAAYIAANEDALPKIAVRETKTKLKTGTKSGRIRPQ